MSLIFYYCEITSQTVRGLCANWLTTYWRALVREKDNYIVDDDDGDYGVLVLIPL